MTLRDVFKKNTKTSIQGLKKNGGFAASSGQLPDP